ncbi:MAG: hypothetical protein Q8865_07595 [Bacillota bacterium]|nr:hypothetical protein [Bacillota bacterium]
MNKGFENTLKLYNAFAGVIIHREGRIPNNIEVAQFFNFMELLNEGENYEKYIHNRGEDQINEFTKMAIKKWDSRKDKIKCNITHENLLTYLRMNS